MATPQLSPGVLTREVDLTVGRAENVLDNIGAIAGPFPIGPVEDPTDVATEQELIKEFGKPSNNNNQYEYWLAASSFLSYGGVLKVVRTDGDNLKNAYRGFGSAGTAPKVKSYEDYQDNHSDDTAAWAFAAKNPGEWGNGIKVCVIDDLGDQRLTVNAENLNGFAVGTGITYTLTAATIPDPADGTTSTFNGYLKGIVTGKDESNKTVDVKVTSRVSVGSTSVVNAAGATRATVGIHTVGDTNITVGSTTGLSLTDLRVEFGDGTGFFEVSNVLSGNRVALGTTIGSAVAAGTAVTFTNVVSTAGSITAIDYAEGVTGQSFPSTATIYSHDNMGIAATAYSVTNAVDWYDQQTLGLTNSTVYWKNIAPKPVTSRYSSERSGQGDAIHIAIYDDEGKVTGIQGNLLEKHTFLSKATDTISAVNSPLKVFYKDYLADRSEYVFAGANLGDEDDSYNGTDVVAVNFTTNSGTAATGSAQWSGISTGTGAWNTLAQGITFNAIGPATYDLAGGEDYGASGGMQADLSDVISGYALFSNKDEIEVDFLIGGPGSTTKDESKAKANYLISIANARKDCMVTISPHKADVVEIANSDTATDNVVAFYAPLTSSSYAVFDTGYKYMYDRFNDKFRYIPTNGDVAGLMVRTNIQAYPWFSPAGLQRGQLNNAIKLAYNPSKAQRDRLYPRRINSIVNQNGSGILLFGDKTALAVSSAFDRINVRRLFLTVEQALQKAAESQLFELNDQITRANFVNIVEPYLRDVQAKRGIYDYLVICDETNNTPDIIDNNEFRADIFLKPAKSINFVTLTFVATRTGVSFEEVAGRA
jgi:hypothetical protein